MPSEPMNGVEQVAQIVHDAMRWAADNACTDNHPEWQGGNSFAEDKARSVAHKIAALASPSPVAEALERAFAAMRKFCDRVEAGEVRSKRTYAEFKEILALRTLDAGKPAEGEEEADMGMLSGCMEFSERPAKKASTSTDDDGLAVAVEAEAQFLVDRIDEMDWSLDAEDFVREWNGHVDPPLCRLRSTLKARKGDAA